MAPVLPILVLLGQVSPALPDELSPPEVEVPFACDREFVVSQAHAVGSHQHNDTWAWDFRMPEGVPIVAALDGTVRLARGDSSEGGCDPKFASRANYVVIAHGNGLETQYLHFTSVVVKPGEPVKTGQLIGYSGKTGWACGSHLHFKVTRPTGLGWNNPSIPARIRGFGDPEASTLVRAPACTPTDQELFAVKDAPDLAPAAHQTPSPQDAMEQVKHILAERLSAEGGAAPSAPPRRAAGGAGSPK